jgi:cysteine desulfurase
MDRVYLDNNSTTKMAPEVLEAMLPALSDNYGNASSVHAFGRDARKAMDQAREIIAQAINADPKEIVLNSGGTEGDNHAVRGVAIAKAKKGKHIIASSIEHHAVLNVVKRLTKEGYEATFVPVDIYGRVNPEDVKNAIREDTILISVMLANNEVGTLQPIREIGAIANEAGITFHTDAVQALGKVPIDVKDLGVDLATFSAHKIHGPKGVGALYARKGVHLRPLIAGGHHERNRRAGTENVAGIVGFGKAVELAMADFDQENIRMAALRDNLQELILSKVDHVYLSGDPNNRLSNTLHVGFNFVEGEGILLSLDIKGIAVATGSACSSGSLDPSHVLGSMGLPTELAQGGIRFSLSRYTTQPEIEYTADIIAEVIPRLRQMSPLWDKYQSGTLDMEEFTKLTCYRCTSED